jgi:hypothetical protein
MVGSEAGLLHDLSLAGLALAVRECPHEAKAVEHGIDTIKALREALDEVRALALSPDFRADRLLEMIANKASCHTGAANSATTGEHSTGTVPPSSSQGKE